MKAQRPIPLLLCAGVLLVALSLSGCQDKAAPLSKEEQKAFKGGPMPADAVKGMQETMRLEREKALAKAGASPGVTQPK